MQDSSNDRSHLGWTPRDTPLSAQTGEEVPTGQKLQFQQTSLCYLSAGTSSVQCGAEAPHSALQKAQRPSKALLYSLPASAFPGAEAKLSPTLGLSWCGSGSRAYAQLGVCHSAGSVGTAGREGTGAPSAHPGPQASVPHCNSGKHHGLLWRVRTQLLTFFEIRYINNPRKAWQKPPTLMTFHV